MNRPFFTKFALLGIFVCTLLFKLPTVLLAQSPWTPVGPQSRQPQITAAPAPDTYSLKCPDNSTWGCTYTRTVILNGAPQTLIDTQVNPGTVKWILLSVVATMVNN